MDPFVTLLALVLVLVTGVYLFLRNRYNFWTNRGFPTVANQRFLYGHVKGINTERHASYVTSELYQHLKSRGDAFGGINMFIVPAVILVDPELIKTILVKDFNVFHDRGLFSNPEIDPLSGTLFALQGRAWRILRQKLTPTFTSGKMKQMFDTILSVAEELRQYVDEHAPEGQMEMKDVLARFTTDVIGTCAFGIECNTLKNPDSEFLKYGNKVFEQKVSTMIKIVFIMMMRGFFKNFTLKITDEEVETFFLNLVRETVDFRERNNVKRNDFMNLLLQIKNTGKLWEQDEEHIGKGEIGMTLNELAAQAFIFFLAGFETSSTTMNFCLYELAQNSRIQERLREEINLAIENNGGNLTYDVVMGIEYLDQVVNETLRKYPPLETVTRAPESDYTIPGTQHVIPKGTMVQIPIYALHHDPDYFPEPERFNPDRFRPEVVKERPAYVYMPFGEGPRICIGLRFGMMQTKVGLITLLRQFRFSSSEKTPERIKFMPNVFVLTPDTGNFLYVEKLYQIFVKTAVFVWSAESDNAFVMALLEVIAAIVVFVVSIAYLFLRDRHAYWQKRAFPCKPNPELLYGHMHGNGRTRHAAYLTQEIYRYAKERGERFIGFSFFFLPVVIVCDLELVKAILVKDFNVFNGRGMYSNPRDDPLSGNLFSLEGHEWRVLRHKLTPTFTSGKMKQMFGTMLDVAKEMRKYVAESDQHEMEMKDVLVRYTTDVIGSCAFGIECNTFKNPDSEFLKYGRKSITQKLSTSVKMTFAMMYRETAKKLGIKLTEEDLESFFLQLVRDTVDYREANNVQRNDFMNLLLQIKNRTSQNDEGAVGEDSHEGMTLNELAAQVFIFFVAGFETSSTVMNFCLYELAKNQDVQDRLREEIRRTLETDGGELTYDGVMGMSYLSQVVNETLRKYPPLESTIRVTSEDYVIPGTIHVIPRRTPVLVPVYAIHHDPEYYPDPECFDPERFSEADGAVRRPACAFLPFGEGPRICIGIRFGLMQVKVGLATLLSHFRFGPTNKTPEFIVFAPKSFILSPVEGNFLCVEKL
ncbi:uncharacterized protein LOC128730995 [Anopheles nili]|uniref:uncharacterized protein LOC128730995 n=1 Tax=Anopheles nili TaxID=185578 RepID=UPI00237BFD55|nr:uncharacterized protein LOC128730995 [Anopheles nili]